MSKLKVGDKVRYRNISRTTKEVRRHVGIITAILNQPPVMYKVKMVNKAYRCEFSDDECWRSTGNELVKVVPRKKKIIAKPLRVHKKFKEAEPYVTQNFKVGDRVQLVDDSMGLRDKSTHSYYTNFKNLYGEVLSAEMSYSFPGIQLVNVLFDNGRREGTFEWRLKKVEENVLTPGTRVKSKCELRGLGKEEGTVVGAHKLEGCGGYTVYTVIWDKQVESRFDGRVNYRTCNFDELEKV